MIHLIEINKNCRGVFQRRLIHPSLDLLMAHWQLSNQVSDEITGK